MGEGLTEARLVSRLKSAGETIKRDEPILELETDKAIFTVESPVDGVVEKWLAHEDQILPIGQTVCTIQSEIADLNDHCAPTQSIRNGQLSPRLRAYCQKRNLTIENIEEIIESSAGERVTETDVDRWITARGTVTYLDKPLSAKHKRLTQHLARAWHEAVPGVIEIECCWDALEQCRTFFKRQHSPKLRPSRLHFVAWCVARAMDNHPKFRSTLIGNDTVREYAGVALGIAVGLPDDELTTAVLTQAESYRFEGFSAALLEAIKGARNGVYQSALAQLIISDLSNYGICWAVPVVVPPAAATLFVGTSYESPQRGANDEIKWEKKVRLVLTFDHRFINGIGAAEFMQEISRRIEGLVTEFEI